MSQLSALAPDERCERITLRGRNLEIQPLRVAQIVPFLKAGGPEFETALQAILGGDSVAPPAAGGLASWAEAQLPRTVQALAIALDESVETLEALYAAELVELFCAVVAVNLDFFVRQAKPAIGRLTLKMLRLAPRGLSANSNMPQPH